MRVLIDHEDGTPPREVYNQAAQDARRENEIHRLKAEVQHVRESLTKDRQDRDVLQNTVWRLRDETQKTAKRVNDWRDRAITAEGKLDQAANSERASVDHRRDLAVVMGMINGAYGWGVLNQRAAVLVAARDRWRDRANTAESLLRETDQELGQARASLVKARGELNRATFAAGEVQRNNPTPTLQFWDVSADLPEVQMIHELRVPIDREAPKYGTGEYVYLGVPLVQYKVVGIIRSAWRNTELVLMRKDKGTPPFRYEEEAND